MHGPVGVIYGDVGSTGFEVAVHGDLRRLDYVAVDHDGRRVLGQVEEVRRRSNLSFEDAVAGGASDDDRLSASVHVIGFLDAHGRVQVPRTPFAAGEAVHKAGDDLVQEVLGLEGAADGALLGHVKGSRIPVRLSMNQLAQKHVSVLAKTGAGKSYTVGVVLEEFLAARVPLVILDPHGEYGSLRHANTDEAEMEAMARFRVKPRSFSKQVREYALDTHVNPDAEKLRLEGMNLTGRQLVDLMGGGVKGSQMGLLYQAVKEVADAMPAYTLRDVMDAVSRNKAAAKWNVLNSLEALDATGLFHVRGTELKTLVRPGQCSIINLKGVGPDIQEVLVARLAGLLWEARKRGDVPPFILVCEEAHNFCPERGVGTAVSGPVLRTVASEGRKFGMGLFIVSQRPAKIDKNVLSQCNTQLVLKVTNPNDLKAIVSSVEGITTKSADEVQRLAIGSALVAGGGLTQPVFVDVRPRRTRHGGGSIAVVEARDPPRRTPEPTPEPDPVAQPQPPVRQHASSTAPTVEPAAPTPPEPAPLPPLVTGQRFVRTPPQRPNPVRPTSAWSPDDVPGIARVARRVGLVHHDDDGRAVETIQRLSRTNHRDPDQRLGLYAVIARRSCHDDAPDCLRCPLADHCTHHQRVRAQRSKSRAGIRRLWRS